MTDTPHFALIAGELSGDILGAALIRALRARHPGARFSGVAGPRMVAEGCEAVESIEALSLMGIAEVLPAIPRLLRLRAALVARYTADRPAVLIGIDAPDFNLGLERRLKARGIATVHMVSPSVWAWREGRIDTIRRSVDLMLCLLPFETAIYARHGLPAVFVGHPLADELSNDTPPSLARHALNLPETLTLAVLPGSRGSEVGKLAVPFAQAVARLHALLPQLQCVTPVAKPGVRDAIAAAIAEHAPQVPWTLLEGRSRLAMQAADVVLLASGTATLECLLLGRPMVVGYRVAALTAFLLRRLGLLKVAHVSLPNLLCGRAVVPELLQDDCSPERLLAALQPLLVEPGCQAAQTDAFEAVRQMLRRDSASASAEAISQRLPVP